ncbi:11375_t:CDS:2 [Cetraspora pellucida]|uniref:11375_t:CDS:1 n=1 Tax=Cetraspora pellucida TaxID=1433469 RepID=A0ACA9KAH2_9GLOM|nr:11375_t:CDS:2 [Cetraspora pellucida]
MATMMINSEHVNLEHVYGVAVHKLQNSYAAREGGLRRFVLLHNFIRKFENNDDDSGDIKKDEEDWLDSCLDGLVAEEDLVEEEDGYVIIPKSNDEYKPYNEYNEYMELLQNNVEMEFAEDIMPRSLDSHEPTHFDPGGSLIDSPMDLPIDSYGSHFEKNFHPYWKDNSIIDSSTYPVDSYCTFLDQNNRSISIPRIFQRYRLSDVSSHINTNALFDLLSKDHPQHFLKRSKDDLDILGSLSYKDLDQGALMDIISMLEYPLEYPLGGKTNGSVTSNANIWFMENN